MQTDFSSLRATAKRKNAKKKREPYIINFDDDKPITVKYPDANKLLDFEEAPTANAKLRLLLTATDYRRLRTHLDGEDGEIITVMLDEIYDLWGSDAEDVPGGKEPSES